MKRELQKIFKDNDTITDIRARRTECLQDENKSNSKLDRKRRIGRPNTKLITDIENDLKRTEFRNWRQ